MTEYLNRSARNQNGCKLKKLLKIRSQIDPNVLKDIQQKYCKVCSFGSPEFNRLIVDIKEQSKSCPIRIPKEKLDKLNENEKKDEAEQALLAEKYKDFEFMPTKVKFLSENIIKLMMEEIPKIQKRNYRNDVITGNVDLLINLENNTYKRYSINFEAMTVEEVHRKDEPYHIWDAIVNINDRILMEVCTRKRNFTMALKEGLIDIYGDTDCCKELKYIIKKILPTLVIRMPSDYSEGFSDEEHSPDQTNLTKFYERWRNYAFRDSNEIFNESTK